MRNAAKLLRRRQRDGGLCPKAKLDAIAAESSQAERRADDAERELIEWKKIRFMQDRVGEDFTGIILSCTKYGFFVELNELFIEGLVPIANLQRRPLLLSRHRPNHRRGTQRPHLQDRPARARAPGPDRPPAAAASVRVDAV